MGSPAELKGAHLLTLHGRQDTIIPLNGGVDGSDEWIFYSVWQFTEEWAKVQGCDMNSYKRIHTPFDNYIKSRTRKGYNLRCFEYTKGCAARVINCQYYGTHMKYVPYDAKLAHYFFKGELAVGWDQDDEPANDHLDEQNSDLAYTEAEVAKIGEDAETETELKYEKEDQEILQ